MAMGRRVLEASMRAIPGIYRNCQAAPLASTVQFNPVVFAEATELVEFAFRCEQVMKGPRSVLYSLRIASGYAIVIQF
jgi:hypothetical protein